MSEMARRFLRQRLGSAGTLVALGLLALLAALPLNSGQGIGISATLAILILASGCVSRDIASGAIQMILSRPLTRVEYLFGRYSGAILAYLIFLMGTVASAFVLGQLLSRLMSTQSGPDFSWPAAGYAVLDSLSAGALVAAIVLLFSTFLRGWGDVLAFVLAAVLLGSIQGLGQLLARPGLAKAGKIAAENLFPSLSWNPILHGRDILAEATGQYVLAICAYLTLAAVVFARREFPYGQD
jgi:ABC-type transport system involved in multi-copper enzyme maturation permease subunit